MDGFLSIVVIGFVIWAAYQSAYKAGKREGSRKGYGVGYDRGKKSQSGCMVALLLLAIPLAAASATMLAGCSDGPPQTATMPPDTGPSDVESDVQRPLQRENDQGKIEPSRRESAITSLSALMRENELRYSSPYDVEVFFQRVAAGEIEFDTKAIVELPAARLFYVPRSDKGEQTVTCKAMVPFRLYKSDSLENERSEGLKGKLESVSVCRAALNEAWFLTKDDQLRKCRNRAEVAAVQRNDGYLYLPEARHTEIILRGTFSESEASELKGLPVNSFDRRSSTPMGRYTLRLTVSQLGLVPFQHWQESWGYYQLAALEREDWDSDFIMNWNISGGLTGFVPDYFHPSQSTNLNLVSGKLESLELLGPDKKVLGQYSRESLR